MLDHILHTAKERLLTAQEEVGAAQLLSILVDALYKMEDVDELQILEFIDALCAGLEKELQHSGAERREQVQKVIDAVCRCREELGK